MNITIKATLDLKPILKILNPLIVTITIGVYAWHISNNDNNLVELHPFLLGLSGLTILTGCISILNYNKRDIIKITQPKSSLKGIAKTVRIIFEHTLDLIIIPTVSILIILHVINTDSLFTIGSTSFIIITIVQISPLKVKKDMFMREANKIISTEINNITMSRCMRQGLDRRLKEYKYWLDRQIMAEERMRVNSDFLTFSSGIMVTMTSITRFLTPILSTVGPILVRMVLGI